MANRQHSYNSGRIHRAASGQNARKTAPASGAAAKTAQKKRRWPIVLICILLALVLALGALLLYVNSIFSPSDFLGRIKNPGENLAVPTEYSKNDVLHVLIIGIDNEEGRSYGEGLGLTDMLLYVRYDLKNNELSLLQIPRDSYVGESLPSGGTGKINALLISGPDKDAPINNLTAGIEQMLQLPVDYYVSMDMDAMKAIVDTFGGIQVYVPQDMAYDGSYLQQGWRWLDGDAAEFFVRNRHGTGFERADIDRLDNQRHFYSALFRRLLNLTPTDITKLLPVFEYYCNTDIALGDIISICVSALNLEPENVLFCKLPGATGGGLDPTGGGRSLYFVDVYGRGTAEEPGAAALLNQYFRDADKPVSAELLGLPKIDIPDGTALYSPNVQVMTDVQAPEGGADVDVEPHA